MSLFTSTNPSDGGATTGGAAVFAVGAATVACGVAAGLIALQTDAVCRRALSCRSLYARRHAEYRHKWDTAVERAGWALRYARFGPSPSNYSADDEMLQTSFLHADSDLDELVDKIIKNQLSNLRVGRIARDERQPQSAEYYIWLLRDDDGGAIYQVPLTSFSSKLADAFERKITSTTFCFVVDASAGVASQLIVDLVADTNNEQQQQQQQQDIMTAKQPLWLVNLADVARKRTISQSTLEQTLFSLCRLEALGGGGTRRPSAGGNKRRAAVSTCLITVGTALAPTLLPLIYKVFPNDRHVFAYTGCCNTIEYSKDQKDLPRSYVPPSVEQALTWNQTSILHSTPFTAGLHKSTNVMRPFQQALKTLPIQEASVIETWMGAVDAFFTLKQDEKDYLPYVLKLDYLLESSLNQYLSLRSLLQYVKGTRSREVPKDTMDKSLRWLIDYLKILPSSTSSVTTSAPNSNKKLIENAVFQHKLILIENKTLQDTVQPAEHWTLKQAMKRGCACCAPEDDEDEDEEEREETTGMSSIAAMSTGGRNAMTSASFLPKSMLTEAAASSGPAITTTTTTGSKSNNGSSKSGGGYVDGKTMFAFDPTRFNTST